MHAEEANCHHALIVSRFAVLFEVLIVTFHCSGVHVILYSNTPYFSLYYIMTIMLHTSTPVIMGFQFVWLTLILYECEYLNVTLWPLYGYVQFN